jgi:hypothetical protein
MSNNLSVSEIQNCIFIAAKHKLIYEVFFNIDLIMCFLR